MAASVPLTYKFQVRTNVVLELNLIIMFSLSLLFFPENNLSSKHISKTKLTSECRRLDRRLLPLALAVTRGAMSVAGGITTFCVWYVSGDWITSITPCYSEY